MPVAGQPDALLVGDARRDVDLEPPARRLPAPAAALAAGRLRDAAVAAAAVAHGGADELPERGARDRAQLAGAVAARARLDRRARVGAVAATVLADVHPVEVDVDGRATRGLLERHLHRDGDVAAVRGASPHAAAEQRVTAEERVEDVRERAEALERGREPARLEPLVPVAVVQRAPFGVGEHLVRLRRLLELLLRLGVMLVHVRVQLAREAAERPLDLLLRGVAAHAQYLVVVALHSSYSSLTK